MRLEEAEVLEIEDARGKGVIYYEKGELLGDITILKTSGFISKLNLDEQKKEVLMAWGEIIEAGTKEYGDIETFHDDLKNNGFVKLSDNKESKKEEVSSSLSGKQKLYEQKQYLMSLKEKMLEEQEAEQSIRTEEGPKLTREKK